jgi:sugar (pentulose or hexulose) kinase
MVLDSTLQKKIYSLAKKPELFPNFGHLTPHVTPRGQTNSGGPQFRPKWVRITRRSPHYYGHYMRYNVMRIFISLFLRLSALLKRGISLTHLGILTPGSLHPLIFAKHASTLGCTASINEQGDCAILGDLLALGNSRLPSVDGQQVRPTLVGSQGAGACPKHNLFAFMITSLN